jgi:hypothetical protein
MNQQQHNVNMSYSTSRTRGLICAIVLDVLGFSGFSAGEREQVTRVSIVQLLADPQRFEGIEVEVVGFAVLKGEDSALYLTEAYADAVDFATSVAFGEWEGKESKVFSKAEFTAINQHYVRVVAKFHSAEKNSKIGVGHMELWSGELVQIRSMTPISKQKK